MHLNIQLAGLVVVAVTVLMFEGVMAGLGGQGQMVGGYRDVKPDDPTVQKILKFAVEEIQRRDNALYLSRPIEIIRAQSQVVSGTNYLISFILEYTNCKSPSHGGTQDVNSANCKGTKRSKCTVKVWYQPWLSPQMQLTSYSCGGSDAIQQP